MRADAKPGYLPNRGVVVAPVCILERTSTNGGVAGAINVSFQRKAADSRVENGSAGSARVIILERESPTAAFVKQTTFNCIA